MAQSHLRKRDPTLWPDLRPDGAEQTSGLVPKHSRPGCDPAAALQLGVRSSARFVVTGEGVIAIDAPPNLGENMLAAIEEVTDAPVTHVVYSHWHSDHIGAASMFGDKVKIIAHDITRDLLARWPDPLRPLPTETFSKDATLDVGGVKLELTYKGENHCTGNIFIYAPKQKVLTKIDIVSPGWSTFFHCDASENMTGWIDAHDQILEYDFDALIAGHVTRYGTRADVEAAREYVNDMLDCSWEVLREERGPELMIQAGPERRWTWAENEFNALANEVTFRTLSKKTSTGELWTERLAGASNMTKYHAWSIMESVRLHRTHDDYQRRGPDRNKYIW
ncbi:MBL fold metallo-hydrolase [Sinorhizobium meliloti]|nr:MBL fold metallo-hydrolase [Sinorhizobium meliloti]